jgi:hypothetical protein
MAKAHIPGKVHSTGDTRRSSVQQFSFGRDRTEGSDLWLSLLNVARKQLRFWEAHNSY